MAKLDELITANPNKVDYNWQHAAQHMFLNNWDMTTRELAEQFVEMRTEQLEESDVKSLTSALENIFTDQEFVEDLQKGVSANTQKMLQMLQAALMATTYQYVHKFHRIIVLNSTSLDAANLVFDINKTAGAQMTDVYDQLKKGNCIHVSNAGVDARNKGIGISVC